MVNIAMLRSGPTSGMGVGAMAYSPAKVFYSVHMDGKISIKSNVKPLRAKVVSNITGLNRYKYCSHSALMGKRQCAWQDKRYVLSSFGKSLSIGRDN